MPYLLLLLLVVTGCAGYRSEAAVTYERDNPDGSCVRAEYRVKEK